MDATPQGTKGAEIVTASTLWCVHVAGPDDVSAAPDFWTALAWAAELNTAVAARAIKQGWANDDNWPRAQATVQPWPWSAERHADSLSTELAARADKKSSIASPRTDGAGAAAGEPPWPEQYASLADGYGPVEEWRDWLKQAGRDPLSPGAIHALRGMVGEFASPAPAAGQAGAVPDSLREALERIAYGVCGACGRTNDPKTGCTLSDGLGGDGCGDGRRCSWASVDAVSVAEAALASHPAGQSTGPGTGDLPPKATESMVIAGYDHWRHSKQPGLWAGPKAEVDWLEGVINAALAARPAAPEAQGAWRPIETAPKDGTHVIAHDEHYGVCEAVWHRAFDDLAEETFEGLWDLNHTALNEATGWQPMPAPPASSGQGGR